MHGRKIFAESRQAWVCHSLIVKCVSLFLFLFMYMCRRARVIDSALRVNLNEAAKFIKYNKTQNAGKYNTRNKRGNHQFSCGFCPVRGKKRRHKNSRVKVRFSRSNDFPRYPTNTPNPPPSTEQCRHTAVAERTSHPRTTHCQAIHPALRSSAGRCGQRAVNMTNANRVSHQDLQDRRTPLFSRRFPAFRLFFFFPFPTDPFWPERNNL